MTGQEVERGWKEMEETRAKVREMFPDVNFPDVSIEPLWYGRRGRDPFLNRKAIIGRIGENTYGYGVISDQYQIVYHEQALDNIVAVLDKMENGFEAYEIHPKMLDDGARMVATITFPNMKNFEITKVGDIISVRIKIFNSYDLKWEYGFEYGGEELRCLNGAVAFRIQEKMRKKHNLSLNVNQVIGRLKEGFVHYADQVETWRGWAKTKVLPQQVDDLWEALPFGSRHKEEILALPQMGTGITLNQYLEKDNLTAWNFHSILTQFLTHNVESELVRIDKTAEVARVFHKTFN